MILTVQQYIEALTNADGRFRTLERIYPVTDRSGDPVFAMAGHGLADFEVMAGGAAYTLRCPLRFDRAAASGLRALGEKEKGLGSCFFTEWRLLESEIVLFGESGEAVEVDILARTAPQGEKAAGFLQKMAAAHDTGTILAALRSFGELTEWSRDNRCAGITGRKLSVESDGRVCVTGFSAHDASPMIALAFFFTAAMPANFAEVGQALISGNSSARATAERLCAASAAEGFPEPAQISAGDVAAAIRKLSGRTADEIAALGAKLSSEIPRPADKDKESYSWRSDGGDGVKCVRDGAGWRYVDRLNRPVIETVWLSASPFREGRAEVEAVSGKGLIDRDGRAVLEPVYEELSWDDYWGVATAMAEGCWSLTDRDGALLTREGYDWLGECSEGLILAQKGGKCGYIDTEGREIIPFVYDDATSFSEGCAFVTSASESFFIDRTGKVL